MVTSKLTHRFIGGIWFAVAAVIPIIFFLRLWNNENSFYLNDFPVFNSFILTCIIPILCAGISGFLLGSAILDTEKTKSIFRAILRGLLVVILSYLMFFIGFTVIFLFITPRVDTIMASVTIFFYGLILVGWLLIIVGILAGILLYLLRSKFKI